MQPCWEFFNCPERFRNKCKVYLNRKKGTMYCEGWIYCDTLIGGPAKRGPCVKCEVSKRSNPELLRLLSGINI